MRKLALIAAAVSMCLGGCAPLLGALMTGSSSPPQAPAKVTEISRTAVDFALNSFDAALYGLDFAMDAGKIKPGSPNAKQIAAVGRKVMNFLGAANAARELGNSSTYEQAFGQANEALKEFRALIGQAPTAQLEAPPGQPRFAQRSRDAILDRAAA
jgi:hypothetical protein